MKGLKLTGWTPQPPPKEDLCTALRNLAVKQVYRKHYLTGQPSTLKEVADKVRQQINTLILNGEWPKTWSFPSKRTIDRRVNEACEPTWYCDGVPRLAAVRAGYYQPNPARFKQ